MTWHQRATGNSSRSCVTSVCLPPSQQTRSRVSNEPTSKNENKNANTVTRCYDTAGGVAIDSKGVAPLPLLHPTRPNAPPARFATFPADLHPFRRTHDKAKNNAERGGGRRGGGGGVDLLKYPDITPGTLSACFACVVTYGYSSKKLPKCPCRSTTTSNVLPCLQVVILAKGDVQRASWVGVVEYLPRNRGSSEL